MTRNDASFILGWEEWLALPELGLPAIKAKVDTGAKTSALHAFQIETFGSQRAPMVRFGVHPVPGRDDIAVFCSAPVIDRRDVTSSNGEKESRFVIATAARMGEREWPIEVTLTNREGMSYRMLLGRQAIREDMFVDAATSFRQPRLSYKSYRHVPRHARVRRALRIALVTRYGTSAASERLAVAAQARGHVLEVIDPSRARLTFTGGVPGIEIGDGALGHYDGILDRLRTPGKASDVAVVRQLEIMGGVALNSADVLVRLGDTLAMRQCLVGSGVACGDFDGEPRAMNDAASGAGDACARFLVIDGKVSAALVIRQGRVRRLAADRAGETRALAERAAACLSLGLCTIDIGAPCEAAVVVGVSSRPALGQLERVSGGRCAEQVIAALEGRARQWTRRPAVVPAMEGGPEADGS